MAAVIEIEGLHKEYSRGRRSVALDGLDLWVPAGGVFGFLGPNGSGKTTTIRCLLGLVRPTSGSVAVLGARVPGGLPGVLGRIGAIVETPAFFPTMTGRENLRLLAAIERIGDARVDHLLGETGLGDRAGDLVRRYSLGMKQRLGLAAALLKDPDLVVLDEPANGLDPRGIRETRELLRRLGAEGRTVFVSSHLLTEVEHTCHRVAIVNRGRCVASGTVADVLGCDRAVGVVARVADLTAGAEALARAGMPVEREDGHLRVGVAAAQASRVAEVLARAGQWVSELRAVELSLEQRFLELTSPLEGDDEEERARAFGTGVEA